MHRVVPELIIENYRAGRYRGEFPAVGMFLDLSGFSNMTDTLMQHGQHGAEVLAGLMHGVFDPLVASIFEYGGKIVGFAGDGIMALYPIESDATSTALKALTSAYVIQKRFQENPTRQTVYGEFSIFAKIGMGRGSVSWGILHSSSEDQATYYFRGNAVDEAAHMEHHARAGDILLTESIFELLRDQIKTIPLASHQQFVEFLVDLPDPTPVVFPPVDLEISRLFMPEEVIANDVRGEFRQVVNLFMRFPDLSNEALQQMMSVVAELRNKYGGLVSRLDFGDKGCNMLMLWGAPVAYGNDIGRALNFLLDLKSAVDFPITAGVTYYISHAGYLGSSMFEDYTCYGWGVNLASRFMMSAPVGEIWVDDRIARRVSNWFEIEFLNSQSFKGFAAEQKVYVLYKHKPTAEPTYQGELVGRDEEFAQLANFIRPLWENKFGGLLLVSGDAGIGKGRLVHEARSSKQFEGKKVLWAICQADQIQRQSFNPLRNWLSRYFGISLGQSVDERKLSFDTKLDELINTTTDLELVPELERTRSVLGALLELYWPESLYEQLDPEGRYNNTFLALIALIKAESLRRPVILFIEDLQFIDSDSKDFLARLKRAILAAAEPFSIAIIVTSRRQGASLEKGLIDARIYLRGLSREALGHMIETLLGGPVAPELVSLVMDRSEGNPYFAEQITRYLQDENLIKTGKQGWTHDKALDEDFLPGDVRAVLVARLDQLARGVRESVQTASVLGRQFEVSLLVHMLRDDKHVFQNVGEAEKASIWGPLDEMHYIFSHGLLRDAAYEMQMQARRRELHALAVDALENLYSGVSNRYAELAHHAKYAEQGSKAQKYYILAGQTAADLYQNQQAIEYYKRAQAFTPLHDLSTQFNILIERVELFNRLGNRTAQLKDLDTLEILATQLNDQKRLLSAKILHARYCFTTGDYPDTIEISEQVVEMSKQLNQAELALGVYIVWSQALFRLGKLEEAMKYAEDGLRLARGLGRRVEEGRSLSSLGLIALESREPGMAQKYLEDAVAIARETKERTLESRALANLANSAAFVQQDYATARTYYEQSYALNVELGDRYAQGLALGNVGWVCGMLGDFASARTYHEQALIISREVGNIYQETYTLMNLSRVADVQGKAEEAVKYARGAMELSKTAKDETAKAWSYLYLGHAYLLNTQFEKAKTAFEKALKIRRELGQSALATEPIAGLIQIALQMNDIPLAKRLMEEIMGYLSKGASLDATEEPLRVYLACYNALERIKDPRSFQILDKAKQLLDAQVSKFDDEQSRRIYIDNIPWRRAIESAWLAKQVKS
jgi:predicted ATPase/class 3 adenylate cyclase